jgi:phosphoribosyl 1,2-cyclic phosphate phosphodiesterase
VLYTHAHADHILGLDDVRPFNYFQKETIPLYANEETLAVIRRVFCYAFEESESSVPRLDLRIMDGKPFDVYGLQFTPIRLDHGRGLVFGYRFGNAAYLTDHSNIPDESKDLVRGVDVLFIDALRRRPHPTHTTLDQAVALVEELRPRRAFFTHMCHDLHHERTEASLPKHVRLAYDGLEIDVEDAA